MAEYRYECRDLRTNAYLGDVPAGAVQWEEGENAATSLSFTVDLAERRGETRLGGQYRDMLRPGRTKVTPLRGGSNPILGSQIVWGRSYDGRHLRVSCAGMWSY